MKRFGPSAVVLALLASFVPTAIADKFTTPHANGMCLGRSGNNTAILQNCNAAPDLQFSGYGEIKLAGLCLSGYGSDQSLRFSRCDNSPGQRWGLSGTLKNEQGYCADIRHEKRAEDSPIVAYTCRAGASHQRWARSASAAAPVAANSGVVNPAGRKSLEDVRTELRLRGGSLRLGDAVQLVAQGGGNFTMAQVLGLIAQGGGNIVGDGGASYRVMPNGSLVSESGGTFVIQGNSLIAQGGGNLVIDLRQARYSPIGAAFDIYSADGKTLLGRLENGNFLVAQGAGNLIAQGGGNVILPNGTQLPLIAQGGGNVLAGGTPLASIINSAMGMNPPVSPMSGARVLLSTNDFNGLKAKSAPPPAPIAQPQPYTPPAPRPAAGSQGTLVNAQNNRCMDVPRGAFDNGSQLVVWDCNGGAGQRFVSDSGFLKAGGKCIAAYDNGQRGARVGLWDCVDHPSQKWTIQGDGQIRGPNNYCIGINGASASNGAALILWDCVNAPNQQWRVGAVKDSAVAPA